MYQKMSRKADSKSEKKKISSNYIICYVTNFITLSARSLYCKQGPDVGFLFV